jgi:hypothetical protein
VFGVSSWGPVADWYVAGFTKGSGSSRGMANHSPGQVDQWLHLWHQLTDVTSHFGAELRLQGVSGRSVLD